MHRRCKLRHERRLDLLRCGRPRIEVETMRPLGQLFYLGS